MILLPHENYSIHLYCSTFLGLFIIIQTSPTFKIIKAIAFVSPPDQLIINQQGRKQRNRRWILPQQSLPLLCFLPETLEVSKAWDPVDTDRKLTGTMRPVRRGCLYGGFQLVMGVPKNGGFMFGNILY